MCHSVLENKKGEDSSNRKALEPVARKKKGKKMAFFGTKVEKQGDRERDQRPTKVQVERRRRKWAHTPPRAGA